MPVVLEGIDLVAIAALFVVVGLLYTIKWWLRPAFGILESTIGKIPGVGGFVTKAENATISALDDAITAVQNAAVDLFKGGVNLARLTGNALLTLATQVDQVIGNLWHTKLPALFHVMLDPIRAETNAVIGSLSEINRRLTADIHSVDNAVDSLTHVVGATIEPTLHDLVHNVIPKLESDLHDVRQVLHNEIGDLARATGRTVDALEHDLTAGLSTAAKDIVAARATVEGELAAGVTAAEAFARSAAGTVERELKDFEGLVPLAQLGTIIAAWPFVYSLAQSLATEAGLGNAECRRKIGDVCGVPSMNWSALLGSLALVGLDFGLGDMLDIVETIFDTVIDDAVEFVTQ